MSDFTKSRKSGHDNFKTPSELYDKLNKEFSFNDDPCPIGGIEGLDREWGISTYVNPPYSNPRPWIEKAIMEARKGKTIVMLLRGDTSTAWFHDLVLGKAEIRFLRGRLKFTDTPAPFPSIVVIYRNTSKEER